jgi:hypothetical protein
MLKLIPRERKTGKRAYGSGLLFVKYGAYYGRWRNADGRRLSRKIGSVRGSGRPDGLTRPQAEKRRPRIKIQSRHSRRMVPTQRSA